jgi:hypothetical protein
MKKIVYFLFLVFTLALFTQCKKGKPNKLENPFGLLALGSDTSLPDGKYVIRTTNGCGGFASTLRCDQADADLSMNGTLPATDLINHYDIDSFEVWYVKKVRYVSPDPDYALAFGYRIYQRTRDGKYRFLCFTATGNTLQWTDDEIGFTYGDGGSKSVKASTLQLDYYPHDPAVPTSFGTSNDTLPKLDTRYLFQFYGSKNNNGSFHIRAGGLLAHSGSEPTARWNFCMAFFNNNDCVVNRIYPHFRGDSPNCEGWDENGEHSRRCWIDEYYFQKVY